MSKVLNPIKRSGLLTAAGLLALGVVTVIIGGRCLLHDLFGIICPGCGIGRACRLLLRFEFVRAWQFNPCVYLLPVIWLSSLWNFAPFRRKRLNRILWCAVIAYFVLFTVLRYTGAVPVPFS